MGSIATKGVCSLACGSCAYTNVVDKNEANAGDSPREDGNVARSPHAHRHHERVNTSTFPRYSYCTAALPFLTEVLEDGRYSTWPC